MEEMLEYALSKIDALEKKLEKYYDMLKAENELYFILNGTYLMEEDINNLLIGIY